MKKKKQDFFHIMSKKTNTLSLLYEISITTNTDLIKTKAKKHLSLFFPPNILCFLAEKFHLYN
jgi:hypothetical protein